MKKFTLIITASLLIAGIALMALPAESVFAQGPGPGQFERDKDRNRPRPFFPAGPEGLERLYDRLVDRYEDVGYRITDSDDITRKLEARIEALLDDGEDASDLEDILAAFNQNMDAVEAAHQAVGEIIAAHEGFTDAGDVADEAAALRTLRQIAEGLLEVHQLGEDARLGLHWDLMTHRYENRPED